MKKLFVFVLVLFFVSFAFANPYTSSNVNYASYSSRPSYAASMDVCRTTSGQDFILQLAPFGCTPAVVRQDLLEEQNVPVFCQIAAIKVNPFIDVDVIESLSFSGATPKEVAGVSFYPARAALGTQTFANRFLTDNIGYAVIVLKKQSDGSAMPDYVSGNLTARIRYDVNNAFGIGRNELTIPVLSDTDWQTSYSRYGFWNQKAFVRVLSLTDEGAFVEVYHNNDGTSLGSRLAGFSLRKGETSSGVSLPGWDCLANVQFTLNEIKNPDTFARIVVGSDVFEVADGKSFLDNKCRVEGISSFGENQKVKVSCRGDDKSYNFDLSINPKYDFKVNGDGEATPFSVGEKVYSKEDGNHYYLVFVGTKNFEGGNAIYDTGKSQDLIAIFYKKTTSENKLSESELTKVSTEIKTKFYNGNDLKNLGENYVSVGVASIPSGKVKGLEGVKFVGFNSGNDVDLQPAVSANYSKAINDFERLYNSYREDLVYSNEVKTYGKEALRWMIELSDSLNQNQKVFEYCELFVKDYGVIDSPSFCSGKSRLASSDVNSFDILINGDLKTIYLEKVSSPSFFDYGIYLTIGKDSYQLGKDYTLYLVDEEDVRTGEFITLVDLDTNKATLKYSLNSGEEGKKVSGTSILSRGVVESFGSKHSIIVSQINLNKVASLGIVPSIYNADSSSTFEFNIAIEKRAIELNPEMVERRIAELNETIAVWQKRADMLGDVVSGMKSACLGVGAFVTIKNFISGLDGTTRARQEVMESWKETCRDLVAKKQFTSLEACYRDKASEINRDVEAYKNIMQVQDKTFNSISELKDEKEKIEESNEIIKKIGTELMEANFWENKKLVNPRTGGQPLDLSEEFTLAKSFEYEKMSLSEAREIERNMNILKSSSASSQIKAVAKQNLYDALYVIETRNKGIVDAQSVASNLGVDSSRVIAYTDSDTQIFRIQDKGFDEGEKDKLGGMIGSVGENVAGFQILSSNQGTFLVTYNDLGIPIETYKQNNGDWNKQEENLNVQFKLVQAGSFKNKIRDYYVKYHSSGESKNLPAIVPFDFENGWYAATSLSSTIASYDSSGRLQSFWLCNVMGNGLIDFERPNFGDDSCQQVFLSNTNFQIAGTESLIESRKLIDSAVNAVASVSRQYRPGISSVRINNRDVRVESPYIETSATSCYEIMSPEDCKLLFNVCDPVICPSSRCDFGGTFPVQDVVQSGILGSLILCSRNWVLFGGDVYIPVCLSGLKAGIDGLVSVFTSYRDCLQVNLETGQMVGFCDEVYSIHLCDFFWSQTITFSKSLLPRLIEGLYSGSFSSNRGGGEYTNVKAAWDGAEASAKYFSTYYMTGSWESFLGEIEKAAKTEVCGNFLSINYPDTSDVWDKLISADSPPQFYGTLDEQTYTTATNPPTSQYKVFYHIYAGSQAAQAYYTVYLKGATNSYYRDASANRVVDSGYISLGGYASEKRDFLAPSGYTELCINVNGQEECGFKTVTTSFAADYISDLYAKDVATQENIDSESKCVSGSFSAYSLVNLNVESSLNANLDPKALQKQGITRICSVNSPGMGTDANYETESARWQRVGFCDDPRVGCWLDTQSVKDVIHSSDLEEQALENVAENYVEMLKKATDALNDDQFATQVREIAGKTDNKEKITIINELFDKVFTSREKAHLYYLRGSAYAGLAKAENANNQAVSSFGKDGDGNGENGVFKSTQPPVEMNGRNLILKIDFSSDSSVQKCSSFNFKILEYESGDSFTKEFSLTQEIFDSPEISFVMHPSLRGNLIFSKEDFFMGKNVLDFNIEFQCLGDSGNVLESIEQKGNFVLQ